MNKTEDNKPSGIEPTFRNGSLTAVSVITGFSLSFLSRWAGLPGRWHLADLAAVLVISTGIVFQIVAMTRMLWTASLQLANYNRSVMIFLVGVVLVAIGVTLAIVGDVTGYGQHVLGG